MYIAQCDVMSERIQIKRKLKAVALRKCFIINWTMVAIVKVKIADV